MLVTSQPTLGQPRREDDVVAVAWNQLADSEISDGMLASIADSAAGSF